MKQKLTFYFLVFSLLIILVMVINQKRIYESQEQRIQQLTSNLNKQTQELKQLKTTQNQTPYFDLEQNEKALQYLQETIKIDPQQLTQTIAQKIYNNNHTQKDHPLIPYPGLEGVMKVNNLHFLNHRWIITDFTDGRYWGEMIIEYTFDQNNQPHLEVIASTLYPLE